MRPLLKLLSYFLLLVIGILVNVSCAGERPVLFITRTNSVLFAESRAAQEGILDFSAPKKLEYRFEDSFTVTPNSSFVIEYYFNIQPSLAVMENFTLIMNIGADFWELPMDFTGFKYAVPIKDSFDGHFSIQLAVKDRIDKDDYPVLSINSISFTDRWFGFNITTDTYINITPFVYRNDDGYSIDVPDIFMANAPFADIEAVFSPAAAVLEYQGRRIETFQGTRSLFLPPALYPVSGQVILSGNEITRFILSIRQDRPVFPEPIRADPLLVIVWPRENWRNATYEIFRWDRFPSLLLFDFADYAVQNRTLKRLAFFVEKAGFRGFLSYDHEIEDLHGWNAHDYKAVDLARFFDTARKTSFPLLDEEWELERILLNEGIIRLQHGNIVEGQGGILSITREAPDFLRNRFMVHEGFHGLFFIDEDFRDFSRRRWEQFPEPAKKFLLAYFDFQQYDTEDEYLVVNEFMGHVLQQSIVAAADYFGRLLPRRLEGTEFDSALPRKHIASGTWPELASAFTAEAQAFSAYVNMRWGLAAGRVWGFRIR